MEIDNQRHSIKQVSEILKIPTGTIREWEKRFKEIFSVPRDENNNRYYTDYEIDILGQIKDLKEKGLGFHEIIKTIENTLPLKPEKQSDGWTVTMQPPDDFWESIRKIIREEIKSIFLKA